MDEPTQNLQQNIVVDHEESKTSIFSIHKKLAIVLFVSMFFLAFGVGAYYMGRQTAQIPITPSITPTLIAISPSVTNTPVLVVPSTNVINDSTLPPQTDYSCKSDADCVVKDAGSCCGENPQCMNINSNPNPDYAKKRCAELGVDSVCGFRTVTGCKCINSKCVNLNPTTAKRDCFPQGECSSNQDCPANMICNQVPGGRSCTYPECPPLR